MACISGDYGNAFLLEGQPRGSQHDQRKGAILSILRMCRILWGPLFFDYGFGPFRWVCTSGNPKDLETTDQIAEQVLRALAENSPSEIKQQMEDNIHWIHEAGKKQAGSWLAGANSLC